MKIKLLIFVLLTVAGCAISHKRGSDAQQTVDYYLENRGELPNELTKMVSTNKLNEAIVTLQWTVNDKGETQNIAITQDTLHNEAVNTLLKEHLKALRFPKAPRFTTTTVEYTYKFQAKQLR